MAAPQNNGGTSSFGHLMWRCAPDQLGFTNSEVRRLGRLLVLERGLVVVAGPAGSGKTTTLYSALRWTQTLRAADPSVTLVGELRDRDVAQLALRASNAGQLVLATVDAPDAASTITHLLEIGVDEAALAATLRGVIAQRLLRRVCKACAEQVAVASLSDEQQQLFGTRRVDSVLAARGCAQCDGQGYSGQMVVAEIAYISPVTQRAIARRAETAEIDSLCRLSGMKALWDAALDRVVAHQTTLQEVVNTLGGPPVPQAELPGHAARPSAIETAPARRLTDRARLRAIAIEPGAQKRAAVPLPKL